MKIVQSLAFVLTIIIASSCKENKTEVSSENVLEENIEIKKGKKNENIICINISR